MNVISMTAGRQQKLLYQHLIWLSLTLLATGFHEPFVAAAGIGPSREVTGKWQCFLQVDPADESTLLPFVIEIYRHRDSETLAGNIVNGSEQIAIPEITFENDRLTINMPHYASRIELIATRGEDFSWTGSWTKRRGKDEWAKVRCMAKRWEQPAWDRPDEYLGRWSVRFADSDDPAVGVFESEAETKGVHGTFLTTTGDYRFLAGGVQDDQLVLSCFDGAHAFLFQIRRSTAGLSGSFRSGNWYQVDWTATENAAASLPDAFGQTRWTDRVSLAELRFPDLNGNLKSLADNEYAGKCRIIEVFGSWCPNCHDAGLYLKELHERYGDQGLAITGLAFELTGEFATDAAQVRQFMRRNETTYPILLAGTASKVDATRQLKVLDRVRSYPTMIFLDQTNQVRAIYTGFSGPATGAAHKRLRQQFESIIEELLNE